MILVVDDDDAYELLLPGIFERANAVATFRFVKDGEQAIEYLSGTGIYSDRSRFPLPKMILLDIRMPKVDGFEVLAWFREQPQLCRLPVVMWSSSELPSDMERAASLGAADYIVKPMIGGELIQTIERIYQHLTRARISERTSRSSRGIE